MWEAVDVEHTFNSVEHSNDGYLEESDLLALQ